MHKLVYVEQEHEGFVVGSDCIRFRVDKAIINPRYFFYFLKSDSTQHWLQAQAGGNGTVMPGMNERILERLEIYLPDIPKQEQIAYEFRNIDAAEKSLSARLFQATSFKNHLISLPGSDVTAVKLSAAAQAPGVQGFSLGARQG